MRMAGVAMLLAAFAANAEPVKCVDAAGKVHYIDRSAAGGMKCEPVRGKASVGVGAGVAAPKPPPAAKGKPAAPEADPREAIVAAERRLEAARKALAEQEATREGGERNYARVEERLAPYKEELEQAQRELDEARRRR